MRDFERLTAAAAGMGFWEHFAGLHTGQMRKLAVDLVDLNKQLITRLSTKLMKAGYSENFVAGAIVIGKSHAKDMIGAKEYDKPVS